MADRWPQSKRNATPAADFAGPHKSFPVTSAKDVSSARTLVGKAADPKAVSAKITSIAKREGLATKKPESKPAKPTITRAGGMARVRVGQ